MAAGVFISVSCYQHILYIEHNQNQPHFCKKKSGNRYLKSGLKSVGLRGIHRLCRFVPCMLSVVQQVLEESLQYGVFCLCPDVNDAHNVGNT